MKHFVFEDRGVIRISGPDAAGFLQGLVSNDVTRADGSEAVYAALLTPQGKFLFDFFIVGVEDGFLLDCWAASVPTLAKKLSMYKLRADARVEDVSPDLAVGVLFGDGSDEILTDDAQRQLDDGTVLYRDPRLADAGVRVFMPKGGDASNLGGEPGSEADYQAHRLALGLPEAPVDLQSEKSILLESGFDELNGVDWNKGCYMGQELTARTKYRGLIKKRLVPVRFDHGIPETGTDVMAGEKVVGDVRSVGNGLGLAMIRLDALKSASELTAGDTVLSPRIPDWMELPADEGAGD